MQRYLFPSLAKVIVKFVLLGPLLWPICLQFVALFLTGEVPDLWAMLSALPNVLWGALTGAFFWWWISFYRNMWLITWAPTVLAAGAYFLAMSSLCRYTHLAESSERYWVGTNALVCAFVSALSFSGILYVTYLVEVAVQPIPLNMASLAPSLSVAGAMSSTFVVGLVGAALGIVIGAFAKTDSDTSPPENRSQSLEAHTKDGTSMDSN